MIQAVSTIRLEEELATIMRPLTHYSAEDRLRTGLHLRELLLHEVSHAMYNYVDAVYQYGEFRVMGVDPEDVEESSDEEGSDGEGGDDESDDKSSSNDRSHNVVHQEPCFDDQ